MEFLLVGRQPVEEAIPGVLDQILTIPQRYAFQE
jgi:hypothetical protein